MARGDVQRRVQVAEAPREHSFARLDPTPAEHGDIVIGDDASPSDDHFELANAAGLIVSRAEALDYHRSLGTDHGLLWTETADQLEVLVMPTTLVTAPLVEDAELHFTALSRNAIPWRLLGWPCVPVPCGCDEQGLPVGVQVVAAPHEDGQALRAARAISSGW